MSRICMFTYLSVHKNEKGIDTVLLQAMNKSTVISIYADLVCIVATEHCNNGQEDDFQVKHQ